MYNSGRLMYSSKLEVLRGRTDGRPDLRYDLAFDTTEELLFPSGYFPAGLAFYRDATGLGVKLGAPAGKMAFFNVDPTDRAMADGSSISPTSSAAVMGGHTTGGSRMMKFFAAIGNFEVSTTEFKTGDVYAVDDPLKAAGFATPATYDVLAGRVRKTTFNTADNIIGVVSRPFNASTNVSKNVHQSSALFFHTVYMPYRADPA